ncbi:MAG: DnaJ domain-containing protein [Myxococcaceae bacterium]|nr:DnaJ domain-containing protein [Myxococcaceae bacterium]MCI0672180.1 DnaJ domain-containing protein [Myxococcaceae bacterium]
MSQGEHIVGLGARPDHIATTPQADATRLGLTPDEVVVLAQVGKVCTIAEVLQRSPFAEPQTLALLLSLRAKGAIAPARVQRPEHVGAASAALQEEVELDPERKQEILALEARAETVDHFSLLGVSAGASPAEVKRAFYALSQRFHPDRFYGRSLGSFRARVERLFLRLSEAHATLTDPERRQAYLKAHPELAAPPAPGPLTPPPREGGHPTPAPRSEVDEERDAERRSRLTRHPYLMRAARVREGLAHARGLVEQGDMERAVGELHRLAQLDPKNAEVSQLLSVARRWNEQARVSQELKRGLDAASRGDLSTAATALRQATSLDPQNAEAAYHAAEVLRRQGSDPVEVRALAQRAVELAPREPEYRFLLGLCLLDTGAKKSARLHFAGVLELEPGHAGAKAQLRKLWWVI